MPAAPDLARPAALLADATRAAIVAVLMDGRAYTATELALEGGVAASTASGHLARLDAGGLVTVHRQGRHRYYALASPAVAAAVEALMALAPDVRVPHPGDGCALRRARSCYDHLAGEAGVALLQSLLDHGHLAGSGPDLALTRSGQDWMGRLGLDVAALGAGRRPLVRPCLDWSERRTHLAGALGAALFVRFLDLRLVMRADTGREVSLSADGTRLVRSLTLPVWLPARPESEERPSSTPRLPPENAH